MMNTGFRINSLLALLSLAAVTHSPRQQPSLNLPMKPVVLGPSQSLYAHAGVFPAPKAPAVSPMPSVNVQLRLQSVSPTQICYTNSQTGVVRCFTPQPAPAPFTGLFILFPCVTSPSNHSVVQSSPDLKVWSDVPPVAFGYSNYTSPWTYMYGGTNQKIGLIVPNASQGSRLAYRIAYRP